MHETTPALAGAAVGDLLGLVGAALGALGMPTNVVSAAVTGYYVRKQDELRRILIDELAAGKISALEASDDDKIAVTLRIMRAANEGAARINLRLLAKAAIGQSIHGQLFADEFHRYADVLASLRREEIAVLAELHREEIAARASPEWDTTEPKDRFIMGWQRMVAKFSKEQLEERERLNATLGALQRTGLVQAGGGWGELDFGTTPYFAEVVRLVDFQDALHREEMSRVTPASPRDVND